jgi:NADP-dependent 3-hydroxy acid dehydrogenase YdfG
MKNFEGKTAVITGAASGIGKSLAEKFAKENMQVVLADIEEDALEKTVENLRHYQHRVIGIKTDVLVEDSLKNYLRKRKKNMEIFTFCAITQELEQIQATKQYGKLTKMTGIGLWELIIKLYYMVSRLLFPTCLSTEKKGTSSLLFLWQA